MIINETLLLSLHDSIGPESVKLTKKLRLDRENRARNILQQKQKKYYLNGKKLIFLIMIVTQRVLIVTHNA